jgi:hypothetical protein
MGGYKNKVAYIYVKMGRHMLSNKEGDNENTFN